MRDKIIEYEHHGGVVSVREDLKGRHWAHCLCSRCAIFKKGDENPCEISRSAFAVCVKYNVTLPMWECPDFVEKEKGE